MTVLVMDASLTHFRFQLYELMPINVRFAALRNFWPRLSMVSFSLCPVLFSATLRPACGQAMDYQILWFIALIGIEIRRGREAVAELSREMSADDLQPSLGCLSVAREQSATCVYKQVLFVKDRCRATGSMPIILCCGVVDTLKIKIGTTKCSVWVCLRKTSSHVSILQFRIRQRPKSSVKSNVYLAQRACAR